MAWPSLLYRQTDLDAVCAHWPARISEYHAQNTLYGHHLIYKQYAGLPEDEPLPWVIEHAISFDKPEPYFAHAQSCLPIILSISESQTEILRQRSSARVEPIGSAFLYMEKLFRQRHPGVLESGGERRGTIVFPCKSSRNEDWDHDSAAYAATLAALPDEYQPVWVSVFWRDFERGAHREFERAGLRLISAGNQEDAAFLFRSLDMCRQFKYACSNQIATSFCYSVLAGCRFFYLPGGGVSITRDGETRVFDTDPTLNLPGKIACADASPFPPSGAGADSAQLALANRFAGLKSLRSPEFFQEMFSEGRRLMKSMVPVSILLDPVERLDRLAPWHPRALDSDGWAMERAGITIPHHDAYAGVRLHLQIPPRPDPDWEAEWSLNMDGREPCFFRVRSGVVALELPMPGQGQRSEVWVAASDPVTLQREARMRCFQITAIEWITTLTMDPFAWGCRRMPDGSLAPNRVPESVSLDSGPLSQVDRASWMLEGVNESGGFSHQARMTLPASSGRAGVKLKISVAEDGTGNGQVRLRVRFEGDGEPREATSELSPGSWYLEAPSSRDGPVTKVTLSRVIPSDGSHPAIRIKQITWRDTLALHHLGLQEQMTFHRMEDLKRLAATPSPPAPPSALKRWFSDWKRKP